MAQKAKVVKVANDTGDGNTKKSSPIRGRAWFFTLNNPKTHNFPTYKSVIEIIELIVPIKYAFQLEKGENGTEHYQGCLYTKNAIAFNSLKELSKHFHWEKCKNFKKSVEYCTKKDTRIAGPWKKGFGDELEPMPEPTGWQDELLQRLDGEVDKREVIWIWENEGNTGKTSMAVWLYDNREAYIVSGNAKDISYALSELDKFPKIIVIDIPRSNEGFLSYQVVEQLKAGLLFSAKYKSKAIRFNVPHVVIFSNQPPDHGKLSSDRWRVYKISPDKTALLEEPRKRVRAEALPGHPASRFPGVIDV
jgi:hypothetical protein